MIKVKITYQCDNCGFIREEETINITTYDEVPNGIENHNSAYLPENWCCEYEEDNCKILCPNCWEIGEDDIVIA